MGQIGDRTNTALIQKITVMTVGGQCNSRAVAVPVTCFAIVLLASRLTGVVIAMVFIWCDVCWFSNSWESQTAVPILFSENILVKFSSVLYVNKEIWSSGWFRRTTTCSRNVTETAGGHSEVILLVKRSDGDLYVFRSSNLRTTVCETQCMTWNTMRMIEDVSSTSEYIVDSVCTKSFTEAGDADTEETACRELHRAKRLKLNMTLWNVPVRQLTMSNTLMPPGHEIRPAYLRGLFPFLGPQLWHVNSRFHNPPSAFTVLLHKGIDQSKTCAWNVSIQHGTQLNDEFIPVYQGETDPVNGVVCDVWIFSDRATRPGGICIRKTKKKTTDHWPCGWLEFIY